MSLFVNLFVCIYACLRALCLFLCSVVWLFVYLFACLSIVLIVCLLSSSFECFLDCQSTYSFLPLFAGVLAYLFIFMLPFKYSLRFAQRHIHAFLLFLENKHFIFFILLFLRDKYSFVEAWLFLTLRKIDARIVLNLFNNFQKLFWISNDLDDDGLYELDFVKICG